MYEIFIVILILLVLLGVSPCHNVIESWRTTGSYDFGGVYEPE